MLLGAGGGTEVAHVKVFDREIDNCWVLFAAVLSVSHKTLCVHYDVGREAEGKDKGAMLVPWKEEHETKASVFMHTLAINFTHTGVLNPRAKSYNQHTCHLQHLVRM